MGQNDLAQKNLILYPDVFADTINALFHEGHKIVKEEELRHAPTESFYHAIDGKLKNQLQDTAMYVVKDNQVKICYMLENQMRVERKMVLRKVGYEGAVYRRQFEEKEVYPVVCAVLYWGKGHWKSPYSIKELLQKKLTDNCVKAAENYIDDIRLQVFEMTHLPQEIRKRFQSDMRVVVDYLAGGKNYKPGHRILKHPEAFLQMIYALTGDLRYEELIDEIKGKETIGMCELLDKYENRGIKKGEENTLIQNIISLMTTMGWTADQAMAALRVPKKRQEHYAGKVERKIAQG